jgi:hypothetical protein
MSPRPLLWVVTDVGANQKVAGSLVLHFEKVVESQVNVKVSNGAVADAKPNHDIGRGPDFALATPLAGTGAHF